MRDENFEVIKHFGPSILKTRIPDDMINKINNYVEKVIADKRKVSDLDNGNYLVADVTQEIRIEKEIMEEIGWLKFLAEKIARWIDIETNQKISEMKMITTWVVRQFENEFNPTHWHEGHISGAGFLKVPSSFGKPFQDNKRDFNGNLTLIHGTKSFMCNSKFEIKPKVGDFYIFPHYLMHTVYPFNESNEERRSISFNAEIDNNIFNVFGSQ